MPCEDCGSSYCDYCREHYCAEPCPCDMSHRCACDCRAFERRVMAD
ncbi:hypothetical protein ACGFY9_14070 [Streptomyces sp. NPDC048504]